VPQILKPQRGGKQPLNGFAMPSIILILHCHIISAKACQPQITAELQPRAVSIHRGNSSQQFERVDRRRRHPGSRASTCLISDELYSLPTPYDSSRQIRSGWIHSELQIADFSVQSGYGRFAVSPLEYRSGSMVPGKSGKAPSRRNISGRIPRVLANGTTWNGTNGSFGIDWTDALQGFAFVQSDSRAYAPGY